jgi:hypothetical protein
MHQKHGMASIGWCKILSMMDLLNQGFDWVMFVGQDVIVMKPEYNLADIMFKYANISDEVLMTKHVFFFEAKLPGHVFPEFDVTVPDGDYVSPQRGVSNADCIFVRNSWQARETLLAWWNLPGTHRHPTDDVNRTPPLTPIQAYQEQGAQWSMTGLRYHIAQSDIVAWGGDQHPMAQYMNAIRHDISTQRVLVPPDERPLRHLTGVLGLHQRYGYAQKMMAWLGIDQLDVYNEFSSEDWSSSWIWSYNLNVTYPGQCAPRDRKLWSWREGEAFW